MDMHADAALYIIIGVITCVISITWHPVGFSSRPSKLFVGLLYPESTINAHHFGSSSDAGGCVSCDSFKVNGVCIDPRVSPGDTYLTNRSDVRVNFTSSRHSSGGSSNRGFAQLTFRSRSRTNTITYVVSSYQVG